MVRPRKRQISALARKESFTMKDYLGNEISTTHGEFPVGGTAVTIHTGNGPVPGTMIGGVAVPNK
jgi:hypothetical protein